MRWANDFTGIPYADLGRDRTGCDCWGLARLVYKEQLGIDLPSYAEAYTGAAEGAEVAALLNHHKAPHWPKITDGILPFDLLLFRHGRHDSHIGIAIDARTMLHMASDDHAKVELFNAPRWVNRFVGAFRHAPATINGALK